MYSIDEIKNRILQGININKKYIKLNLLRKYYKQISVNGKQKPEHRLMMEKKLGRILLPNELVHHINDNHRDNRIENLQLTNRGDHMKIHNVGISTRFFKQFEFNADIILEKYKTKTSYEIAEEYGCSNATIIRFIQKHNIRDKIVCSVCGKVARYRRKQFCNKHYLEEYRLKRKSNI